MKRWLIGRNAYCVFCAAQALNAGCDLRATRDGACYVCGEMPASALKVLASMKKACDIGDPSHARRYDAATVGALAAAGAVDIVGGYCRVSALGETALAFVRGAAPRRRAA